MRLRRMLVATLPMLAICLGLVLTARPAPTEASPQGFLISGPDGNLFLVYNGVRHRINSSSLPALGIVEATSSPVSQATLQELPAGADLPLFQNGMILSSPAGHRYLLFNGLHPIPTEAAFRAQGWAGYSVFDQVEMLQVDGNFLAALPQRAPVLAAEGWNRFDWGYCTWWVAKRRDVTWMGNAIEWYDNAQEQGYNVGDTPMPGAILVRRSAYWNGYGHVAYVESVSGTTFTVSEMNVQGLGVLSTRTYDMQSDPPPGFVGFIYWRFGDEPIIQSDDASVNFFAR